MWDGFELPGAVRHELRGFGQTPLPPAGQISNVDDLERALKDRPAALVGASFGGIVCLELASRRPDLARALVLLDSDLADAEPSAELIELDREEDGLVEQGDVRGAARLNARFWLGPDAPAELHDRVTAMAERAFELQLESAAEIAEPEPVDLSTVRAPALVIVGEHDRPHFHEVARRLVRELPSARLEVIAGAGHLPSMERPERTLELVRDFLSRI
jgi:pimeloyl-ACP methyl ester carboxylesterase